MLLIIPSDIIVNIMSFLNDKTNTCLVRTCKDFCNHGKKYGFVTYINADLHTNMKFIQRFCQHSKSIKSIKIRGVDDPHIWLPHYVEKIYFDHCAVTSYVNPGPRGFAHRVKFFKFTDYDRYKCKKKLRVNWGCFPNLEELELYVHDVDMTGLDQLKELKKVKINTSMSGTVTRI